jgi:ligand-binding sensor domain-containing protein
MKTTFKILLICLLLIVSVKAMGDNISVFRQLTTNDGLSNSYVKTFLRDSYGFLWIGTELGLNRYDGYEFKVYYADDINGLPTNDIQSLQEDGLGNIWVECGYGYLLYNREKDNFKKDINVVLKKMGINVDSTFNVHIDQNKDLWVFSNKKVFYYNTRIKELKIFVDNNASFHLEGGYVTDDGDGILSILPNGALLRLDKFSGQINRIEIPFSIVSKIVNAGKRIFVDKSKGIWLYAYKSDLFFYKKSPTHEWQKVNLISNLNTQTNIVQSLVDDEQGNVWIGTDHKGLFLFNKENGSIQNYLHDTWERASLSSNNVSCLYRDNNDVIWIGHYKKGVSSYCSGYQSIINFQHPECREVTAILEDRLGNIWLATDGNGLFIRNFNGEQTLRKVNFPNYAIVSLLEDSKGRVWIGTFQNGLFCYEGGKISQFTQANSQLLSDNIWNIQEDRYGNLWVGSLVGGIQSLNPNTKSFFPSDPADELVRTLGMFYDSEHKLYIGNVFGLSVVDFVSGRRFMYYGNNKGTQQFKQMMVSNVYKSKKDVLLLGHHNGLSLWDLKTDSIYELDKKTGLSDKIIRAIIEDDNQNIWLTTSNGVTMLKVERNDKGELIIESQIFSTKDGFIDNYFNANAIAKLRNGNILIGGPDGYTLVKPSLLTEKRAPLATVVFTGLKVGNQNVLIDSVYNGKKLLEKPLEATNTIEFSHKNKLISFQITAGDLINASKVKYMYKLEGFNQQWLVTNENVISFSTIPPGSYRLLVKACNSDGVLE